VALGLAEALDNTQNGNLRIWEIYRDPPGSDHWILCD
jgi:hypothetical protein